MDKEVVKLSGILASQGHSTSTRLGVIDTSRRIREIKPEAISSRTEPEKSSISKEELDKQTNVSKHFL